MHNTQLDKTVEFRVAQRQLASQFVVSFFANSAILTCFLQLIAESLRKKQRKKTFAALHAMPIRNVLCEGLLTSAAFYITIALTNLRRD